MAVVVTGASGFVGRHVVADLRRRGHAVVGIDRRPADGASFHITADLTDRSCDAIDDVLADADAVVHLAGCPGVRGRGTDLARARWRDNLGAGLRVLEATPHATPLVVASSSSVYGGAGHAGRVRASHEHDPLRPHGDYARTKAALELACAGRATSGGHVAVARPFTVAGEGQRPDMAVARWIAALSAGRPAVVLGSPARRRDVTDVRQVANALITMLEREVTGTVNLGTGTTWRLDELIAGVAAALGCEPTTVVRPAGPQEPAVTLADTRRCRRLLGMDLATDMPALLARQVAATRESRPAATPATAG